MRPARPAGRGPCGLFAQRTAFPDYQEHVRANTALWILDTDVVDRVMEGLAEAEALVGQSSTSE